ncbi:hypothetical protein QBC32DRAFT_44603 [Pseudoneurospora amorphoporcata]|uniref:CCHC-type domain-containing protein n=1 Tax=Pseudoneurospora amorphoporcata TaxID=241081 RepID=A0AAN6NNC8_9PEZI|nr:hypothetical protein QBC32DRAFT_44603 [Pseudoneurospora amorphoporcata]
MAPANLPTMAAPQAQKTMSSRLMTMKFMQRAAATAATAAPTDKSSTPKTEDEGPSKRRKHSHASKTSTPNPEAEQALFDQKAIQAALEEEEKKRQAAVEKRAAELGDSYWVLPGASVAPKAGARPVLNVVQVGFAQIDYSGNASDEDDVPPAVSTTPRFRQFNIKKKKEEEKEDDDDDKSDSDSDSSGPDSDSDDRSEGEASSGSNKQADRGQQGAGPRGQKRARPGTTFSDKRSEERKKAAQFALGRRKREVNPNRPATLSSGGQPQGSQRQGFTGACHTCGQNGHRAADCPRKSRK